mmetsp:Transcript_6370/g.7806  ORF Transcript_6370/g.7806 Transcript_6370/m.7806 type:complete len:338 (-) Transcript_6370:129-1142(-)|eukprot:CAMPEP_0195285122 /NCGR_PEP_ID=MMETSP0707-20130614/3072_1 /TAXON_ID=33640 /ORGANISM="Asterionellopsis glacialis, Strain CCMP134" /LENGTH=337 /DNA_ID=CAMNT_0040344569 /DNA_START=181 /DNA_END=1194 /DNA_ORIENTATION=-
MAKHLARIHGTEEDKVNCPFYFKIGACRHSDRCSRLHHRPAFSPTILLKHLFRHPIRQAELQAEITSTGTNNNNNNNNHQCIHIDTAKTQEDFLCFFEDLFCELSKFGRIEALHVCDNLGDHMIGHVYCKFSDEEQASDALQVMNGRYYDGRKIEVEYSPVTDFREARCRDFDEDTCSRGGYCNFMHIKPLPMPLIRSLEDDCEEDRRQEAMKRDEMAASERDRERRKKERKRSSKHRSSGDRTSSSDDRKRSRRHHHSSGSSSHRSSRRSATSANDDSDGGGGGGGSGRGGGGGSRSRSRSPPSSSRRSSSSNKRSYSRSRSRSPSSNGGNVKTEN